MPFIDFRQDTKHLIANSTNWCTNISATNQKISRLASFGFLTINNFNFAATERQNSYDLSFTRLNTNWKWKLIVSIYVFLLFAYMCEISQSAAWVRSVFVYINTSLWEKFSPTFAQSESSVDGET